METGEIENDLQSELTSYLEKTERLPLHPKNKISIITKYVYSKFCWRLSIYQLSETWITRNLDDKIITHLKRWLKTCSTKEQTLS